MKTKTKWFRPIVFGLLSIVLIPLSTSCNPEAKWETKNVHISMTVETVSAGFIECKFSTDKDAYYLIAIEEPWADFNPMANQKQFMTLALDSAYSDYLSWRYSLLRDKEFTVAPFASHSLQYGEVNHFFTGLLPDRDYWVYAFVVNPSTMTPEGSLTLQNIRTTEESIIDVHFDYRVKGVWDYIYPMDSLGNIYSHFPYIATTVDSATLAMEAACTTIPEVVEYFVYWSMQRFLVPDLAEPIYGVRAVKNDGEQSDEVFQKGHTYYTALSGYDGSFRQTTIYKFTWTGDSCELYLRETDPANIINLLTDEEPVEE